MYPVSIKCSKPERYSGHGMLQDYPAANLQNFCLPNIRLARKGMEWRIVGYMGDQPDRTCSGMENIWRNRGWRACILTSLFIQFLYGILIFLKFYLLYSRGFQGNVGRFQKLISFVKVGFRGVT